MADLVERHFGVLRAAVAGAGGEVFATLGDGIAAAFDAAAGGGQRGRDRPARPAPPRARRADRDPHRRRGSDRGRLPRSAGEPSGADHGRWPRRPGPGADITALLLRSGSAPIELAEAGTYRLRDLAEPERLWQVVHPDLRRTFPSLRTATAGAPTCRRRARRSSAVRRRPSPRGPARARAGGDADRCRRGRQDPARRARRRGPARPPAGRVVRPARLRHRPGRRRRSHRPRRRCDRRRGAALQAVVDALGSRPALLVVDNCEHVVAAVAAAVGALVAALPAAAGAGDEPRGAGDRGRARRRRAPAGDRDRCRRSVRPARRAAGADVDARDRCCRGALCPARRPAAGDRARRRPRRHARRRRHRRRP